MNRLGRLLVVAAVIHGSAVCSPRGATALRGLVIITLDTTRADRLPAYGFMSAVTPALNRIAREGIVFDRATSVAPLTLTAHTSLFTGLYPPHHGVRDNADLPLDRSHATLAEAFHAQGFETAAFVGSMVLAADRGLARGFDVYDEGRSAGGPVPRRRPGREVVGGAEAWLDRLSDRPFFLWIHLYDAHAPQTPAPDARPRTGDAYEDAIVSVDTQIGRVLDTLARRDRLRTTAILVAADHGESLGEHGEREHGIFLYEGALHIPLIVRVPGVAARRVADLASLVDVAPTVRALFGLPREPADGVSLVPAFGGAGVPARLLYAESMYPRRFGWSPLRMVTDGRYKYIDAPRAELYDLDQDPFERTDCSSARPDLVRALHARLASFGPTALNRPDEAPSGNARALAALGYISRTPQPTMVPLDPKDYIQVFNAVREHAGG